MFEALAVDSLASDSSKSGLAAGALIKIPTQYILGFPILFIRNQFQLSQITFLITITNNFSVWK